MPLWRILRLSALAFFGTLAVIAVLNARMKSTGGPGILSLEFAGSRHRALQIMDEWGRKGITAARWGNVVDYGFLAAYAVFLRPLHDLILSTGSLVIGVWGIRSILVPSNIAGRTGVDVALGLVILFLLGAIGGLAYRIARVSRRRAQPDSARLPARFARFKSHEGTV